MSRNQFSRYVDGYYATPRRISRTPRSYPFALNGDLTTAVYTGIYLVDADRFTPTARGTVDPENAGFYLLTESEPEVPPGCRLATFRRTYSNIPAQQIEPAFVQLTKPEIAGTFSSSLSVAFGDYSITQPDTTLKRYDIYRRRTVTTDQGIPGFYPGGGTYTITFGGATTGALNYNDAAATVQTALNALTPVSNRASVAVGGAYNSAGGLTIAFSGYAQITLATGSLTGGTIRKSESLQNVGATQTLRAWRDAAGSAPTAVGMGSLTYTSGSPLPVSFLDYTDASRPRITNAYRFTFGAQNGFISGGTWTLSIAGHTTAAISANQTLGAMKTALQADLDAAFGAGVIVVSHWPDAEAYYGTAFMDAFNPAGASASISFLLTFTEGGATGGTFTITVGADTTAAIAYNASAAAIQTALNLLASVTTRGGVTVTGDLTAGIAVAFVYGDFTVDVTSLTPGGSTITPTVTDSGVKRTHKLVFQSSSATRDLFIPEGHGVTDQQLMLIASGTSYFPVLNYLVLNSQTLRLIIAPADGHASAGSITAIGVLTKALYAPGTATVRASRVTDFYLPGVSSGITTLADIPVPRVQSEPDLLKLAIFAGEGELVWQAAEPQQWRESKIVSMAKTVVDVIDI